MERVVVNVCARFAQSRTTLGGALQHCRPDCPISRDFTCKPFVFAEYGYNYPSIIDNSQSATKLLAVFCWRVSLELEFFGAAGEVTGSCHILRVAGRQVLLDCGMIQGGRKDEARNADPFPFDAKAIDAVVLSHAHIDHSGRLPLLARRGFGGPIHCQNATRDLTTILLRDSASLQERDVQWENRRRARKDLPPIDPLYSRQDADRAISLLVGYRYTTTIDVCPGVSVRFLDAGHIMGSAVVEVTVKEGDTERRIVFSGDLGQHDAPILRDPQAPKRADLVLMESTYGNRTHRDRSATIDEIGEIITDAESNKGSVFIPAFAVGRSQEVLYQLGRNYEQWGLDRWHVFLDSPMAIEASKVYWDYPHLYDDEATLFRKAIHEMPRMKNLHLTTTSDESRAINKIKSGAIVLAGSGMCNGGRILHHLKHNLWRKECHLIFVGYQARGTIGRLLVDGRDRIRIHRESIKVKAKIHTVGGLSAHGDRNDLARWLTAIQGKPPVYLVHGEVRSAEALKKTFEKDHDLRVNIAEPGLTLNLESLG